MKARLKNLLPVLIFILLLSACAPPLPTPFPTGASPEPTLQDTSTLPAPATIEPTQEALQLSVHPPGARTGLAELDRIIDAVLAHDFPALKELTYYLEIGCSPGGGLGGPPVCLDEESAGTILEVVPFLGTEGHHQRRPEYEQWAGPDVLGLLAAYRTSAGTWSDPAYPAGEYGLVFLSSSGSEIVTLQVSEGLIVRYDFNLGKISPEDLEKVAGEILLPLSVQSPPTGVPWNQFQDPQGRFSFQYPPSLQLGEGNQPRSWTLGDRIRVEILTGERSWITCFDQALGDCPAAEEDGTLLVNGAEVRRVAGYIGSIGGNIPQQFITHIFPLDGSYLVITLYALPFDTEVTDVSRIWPLDGMALELYGRIVATVQLDR